MSCAQTIKGCVSRMLGRSALFLGTAYIFLNLPARAAEANDAPITSDGSAKTSPAKEVELPDLPLEQLLNVEITTASKSEEKQSDAPGIVSVITRDEIKRFGGTTLKDILTHVPGLAGSTVYMTDRSMISVRGDQVSNSGEHVLLLINGRPVREVQEGGIKSEILETFPVDIIERIEVIKGPGSVLYGSTAFSGVINVITIQPDANGGAVTGLGGEAGAYDVKAFGTYTAGDFSMIAAGQYLEKANWPVNYAATNDLGGTLNNHINIPNKGLGTYLGANYKDFSLMMAYNQWETAYFIPDLISVPDPFFHPALGISRWKKLFTNLGYDTEVNDRWRTTVNLGYTQSKFETTTSAFPAANRNSYEAILEWANFIKLTDKAKLTLGGLGTRIDGKETGRGITTSEGHRLDFGLYAQAEYQLLKNLKVIGGAQANKIENLNWDVVPRGGVIWYPVPRINVKALYGQAFRAPSINETSLNDPGLHGDPNIKSEKVGTIDLGITYQGDRIELGVSLFRSELTDIIFQDRSGPGVAFYANQSGTITIQGAEFESKYYVTKAFFLTGSAIYQTSQDGDGNHDVSPIASFGAKAGISYVFENGLTASLFDIYQGPLADKYDSEFNPSPGAYNRLDLHLELNLKKFFHWKVTPESSLILQADNLLDQQIWLPAWGLLPGQSLPYEQGRAIYAGLRIQF